MGGIYRSSCTNGVVMYPYIEKRFSEDFTQGLNNFESYVLGMMDCRMAIIDLLLKINDENYNVHGEHINQSCREEAETIERIIALYRDWEQIGRAHV